MATFFRLIGTAGCAVERRRSPERGRRTPGRRIHCFVRSFAQRLGGSQDLRCCRAGRAQFAPQSPHRPVDRLRADPVRHCIVEAPRPRRSNASLPSTTRSFEVRDAVGRQDLLDPRGIAKRGFLRREMPALPRNSRRSGRDGHIVQQQPDPTFAGQGREQELRRKCQNRGKAGKQRTITKNCGS